MSLIAWYPLVNDTINKKNKYGTTVRGAILSSTDGKIGNCYNMAGTGDILTNVGNGLSGSNLSVSLWVKLNVIENYKIIIGSDVGNNQRFYIGISNNKWCLGYGIKQWDSYMGTAQIVTTDWTHLCLTSKDNLATLYVNGIATQSYTYITSFVIASNFFIGSLYEVSFRMNVLVNDVKIYDNSLSLKEIRELYKSCILHYSFNNSSFEPTTNMAKTASIITSTNYAPGWDITKHIGAVTIANWSSGYNSGVPSAAIGYHAHWILDDGIPVMMFPNLNSEVSLNNRWLGITQSYTGSYFIPSTTYCISWEQKVSNTTQGARLGLYHRLTGSTTYSFYSGLSGRNANSAAGTWERKSYTFTILSNYDTTINPTLYIYGEYTLEGITYVRNVMIEQKDHKTSFITGGKSRGSIVTDESGYGNNGIGNNLIYSSDSNYGSGCACFNGINSYISVGRSPMVKYQLSINVWSYMPDWSLYSTSSLRLISCTEGGGWNFEPTDGKLSFTCFIGTSYMYAISNILLSALSSGWHMFTGIYDGRYLKLYIDGILEGTVDCGLDNTIVYNSTNGIFIGAESGTSITNPVGNYLNGRISDLKIYASALTQDDISQLFSTKITIDNEYKLYCNELIENHENLAHKMNLSLLKKTFTNGISKAVQSNCQVTLADDGLRIYRPANLSMSVNGKTMWGGMRLRFFDIDTNILQKNHTYLISFMVKGVSFNEAYLYFSNNMGWEGYSYGLTNAANWVVKSSLQNSFNGEKEILGIFNIPDDIYKTCTSSYSTFLEGSSYNCYRDLAFGFNYTEDTGINGTDIYINNIQLYDITDSPIINTNAKGIVNTTTAKELNYLNNISICKSGDIKMHEIKEE